MAFKLCKKGNCGVTITDLNEYQIQSYLTRSSTIYYTFMQSASINTLSSINYEGESTLQAYKINTHYETDEHLPVPDESDLDFVVDGLYEVNHLILPTLEWYETYKTEVFGENGFTSVYFIDGEDVYKVNPVTREIIKVEIEELLEINPKGSTIIKETKNTFSLCHLLECFYNICKDLLSKLCPINCNSKSSYQELILNRDIMWMAINVIRYCIDLGQYYEAQRFLEQIQGCGTICRQYDINKLKQAGGCGCSR